MKFAILAAGEGARLREEGLDLPKPLIKIKGETMVDRLVRIFNQEGAEEIVIICNTLYPETAEHIKNFTQLHSSCPLRLVEKTTPSSMHSFYEIAPYLQGAPFCMTTVDTIFKESEFCTYIKNFVQSSADGLMAVTDFIDDEKPLYIQTDADHRITSFDDERPAACRFISGGIYALRPSCLDTLQHCIAEGKSRMRNFQRQLLAERRCLYAYPFSKILDVDHVQDIRQAEAFLSSFPHTLPCD